MFHVENHFYMEAYGIKLHTNYGNDSLSLTEVLVPQTENHIFLYERLCYSISHYLLYW